MRDLELSGSLPEGGGFRMWDLELSGCHLKGGLEREELRVEIRDLGAELREIRPAHWTPGGVLPPLFPFVLLE